MGNVRAFAKGSKAMAAGNRVTLFNPLSQLTSEYCDHLQEIARFHAHRNWIDAQDREDCVGEFVLHVLLLHQTQQHKGNDRQFPAAWLNRCAANHAVDFQRRRRRLARHESGIVSDDVDETHYADAAPSPEAQALAKEFFYCLQREVYTLTPMQRDLFTRLIVNDETASEAGLTTGRTTQAILQSRSNLCRQLRVLLERHGVSEADLREYVMLIGRVSTGRGGGAERVLKPILPAPTV